MDAKQVVAAIGQKARLVTMDGFEAIVEVLDVKPAYGQMRAKVGQSNVGRAYYPNGIPIGPIGLTKWIDASRLRPIEV